MISLSRTFALSKRCKIGAVQNRLSFTISNLSNYTQAIEAGRSSIEDVDIWLTRRAHLLGAIRPNGVSNTYQ
ncbi:MAG: flagellin [Candidatus Poribacteria bacterium]|nr:flagellin [Candidatus Poribacteria bacterium]